MNNIFDELTIELTISIWNHKPFNLNIYKNTPIFIKNNIYNYAHFLLMFKTY